MKCSRMIPVVLSTLSFAFSATGQELLSLTLEDLIPGGSTWYKFTPGGPEGVQWWGDHCVYTENIEDLMVLNPADGSRELLFTFQALHEFLDQAKLNRVYRPDRLTFPEVGQPHVCIQIPAKGYLLANYKDWTQIAFIPVPLDGKHEAYCHPARAVAYTQENNLYLSTPDGQKKITDEPQGVLCGQSVHRDEFGIHTGTFWNPKGSRMAFYRMDERMVTNYPLLNTEARCAEVDYIRYPMAGMASHEVSIGIYNLSHENVVFLQTESPVNRYFTNVTWSPDGEKIFLIELNRDQNHAQLVRYDAETGKREEVLYEESHINYVHPQHPIVFLPWNPQQFILWSEHNGYNHLYLYNTEGTLLRQLTEGEWVVQELLGFDEDRQEVVIRSNEYHPLQSNVFRVPIAGGARTFMGVSGIGWQQATLSPSGRYMIESFSAHDTPRELRIVDGYGENNTELYAAKNPYEDYSLPVFEVGTIRAADTKTELYYRLLKPPGFDPAKTYPVIVYTYGGPGVRLITDKWLYEVRGWDIYMANRGYLVFSLDNRGSSERGLAFENCTFRSLGLEECKDQMKGVEFLKTLPYVDADRIGVHGWSYGGYMTISLMLRNPGVFKAGVAGGAVTDWKLYEIMYGERYMDAPQDNPEGYEACDLKHLAGCLSDRLLLIHDTNDPVVVPQHLYSFQKACIDAGSYPDLFLYPGHGHNVLGRDRVHLYEKVTRYFDEYLK